ncbi:hypothetical protein [Spirosoma luteum]|uniref:hypothetical protein n=1 Tax=Spirosoma luteum TaxID=431553 RepID=UPI00036AC2C2|nr:hypothetical protein [Spirosoma luteum]
MFSQYSWWDFAKIVLVLAIPYYAYVLIRYYREDIREWISNRGQKDPVTEAQQADEEEEEPSFSRFSVNDYSDEPYQTTDQPKSAEWLPSPPEATQPEARTEQPVPVYDQDEYELQGPDVDDQPEHLGVPVLIQTENLQEQSIDEIRSAAERLTKDGEGRVTPVNAEDKPAARIADIINQQQGHLDSFAFNR